MIHMVDVDTVWHDWNDWLLIVVNWNGHWLTWLTWWCFDDIGRNEHEHEIWFKWLNWMWMLTVFEWCFNDDLIWHDLILKVEMIDLNDDWENCTLKWCIRWVERDENGWYDDENEIGLKNDWQGMEIAQRREKLDGMISISIVEK